MELTINSRILGHDVQFWAPPSGGYIRSGHSALGQQICEGGRFTGNTLTCSDYEDFKRQCRRWYRAYSARIRAEY